MGGDASSNDVACLGEHLKENLAGVGTLVPGSVRSDPMPKGEGTTVPGREEAAKSQWPGSASGPSTTPVSPGA
jgi:hypothetical protein